MDGVGGGWMDEWVIELMFHACSGCVGACVCRCASNLYVHPVVFLKVRLPPLQSALNIAPRLVAHLPGTLVSLRLINFLAASLHAPLQFKILNLIMKDLWSLAPKYLVDELLRPHSASSNRLLRSSKKFESLD